MRVKKYAVILIIAILSFTLCGCKESARARLDRLTREADQKKREAKQAQDEYNQLKYLVENLRK